MEGTAVKIQGLLLVKLQGMLMVTTKDLVHLVMVIVPRLPMTFLLEALLIALPARGLVNSVLLLLMVKMEDLLNLLPGPKGLGMDLEELLPARQDLGGLHHRLLVGRHILGPQTNLMTSGGSAIWGMHQIFQSLSALSAPLQTCRAREPAIFLRGI